MSKNFADLGVSRAVVDALSKRGFTEPFAIQRLVIEDVLKGRDVLAKSPTGSGKTLAFAVPMSDRIAADSQRPACLVLAPTRELASQIVEEWRAIAHSRALRVAAVYGGVGIQKQANEAKRAHIVVATPGRLEDLIARRAISLKNVRTLVLDEADRMLDMGFRPVIDRLVSQCPRDRQTLFFSATLDGEAGRIAREYTKDAAVHEHVAPKQDIADIQHRFVSVERTDRIDALKRELRSERDRTLVFVRTKRGADRLVKRLAGDGVEAVAMHGDKTQGQRERALARFESGKIDTLVATDVAARGIDVNGISHVINFDPPEDREGYVHRTGRTGRAGRTGEAVTFVGGEQASDVGKIAHELRLHAEFEKAGLGAAARSHGAPRSGGGGGGNRGGGGAGGGRRRQRSSTGTGSTTGSGRNGGGSGRSSRSGQSGGSSKVASARPSGRRSGRR
ncbi:MAG: ATP-dependent helicase RhlE [Thermoleophilaceae bacterium]|jgi:superfamily II DNA/RNA helicase|nr:ATP-dependent helicase RhlE [Thermoleophilaceae bacterium]